MTPKVIHAVTVADSLYLQKGQLAYLEKKGYEVNALCSDGNCIEGYEKSEGIKVLKVNMEREISLVKDFQSLVACIQLIRQQRPDIVNAGTPKAGLIVTLAAFWCGVPIRIYSVLGLRMETTVGLKRKILLAAEKIAASAATNVVAVSPSLKEQLIKLGITQKDKVVIFGEGSVNGFDLESFKMTEALKVEIDDLREKHSIHDNHLVIGFTGRMTKDKGIEEMVESFVQMNKSHSQLRLLIVGEYETGDPVKEATQSEIKENPNIIHVGEQANPVPFYYLMNIFLFLTKREGFGNVSLEAALAGVPVIAADVTGARDTIIDGATGILVDPENIKNVMTALEKLILDPQLRIEMGTRGKKRGEERYGNEKIWKEMEAYYQGLLKKRTSVANQVSE